MHRHCSRRSILCWTIVGILLLGRNIPECGRGRREGVNHLRASYRRQPEGNSEGSLCPSRINTPICIGGDSGTRSGLFRRSAKIQSVKPDEGKPGGTVTPTERFWPCRCLRSVSFGPGYPAAFTFVNDTQITATVPKHRRNGNGDADHHHPRRGRIQKRFW